MRKQFWGYILSFLALAALVVGMFGMNFASAKVNSASQFKVSGHGKAATVHMTSLNVVNMQNVPAETAKAASKPATALPFLTGVSPAVYKQRKAAAAHNSNAPTGNHPFAAPTQNTVNTPKAGKTFKGMADSASICPYFGGCQPPDMALATSKGWVFQGVNTSFAVYSPAGKLQTGWPKSSQAFFNVPNPGTCDPNGPFLSDPRAFFDPNDNRFWAATLQVEGAFGLNSCPFQTLYWIAVSQTANPNGAWNVYAFDMSLGTTNAADYTQFGFDQTAIYFSGNMFNQAGSAYEYAEMFGANKSNMEKGLAVSFYGFYGLYVSGSTTVYVDTVQPVETEAYKYAGPTGGLFVDTFNMNGDAFGDNCYSTACHGLNVWALSNPGQSSTSLSYAFADTYSYVTPPFADEPGCTGCIETLDNRISGTPVYHDGLISFAYETGAYNGTQNVGGVQWGQVALQLGDTGSLTGATMYQQGLQYYSGDGTASFGALMPDAGGDLFMVFDYMDSNTNPEAAYAARRVSYSLGSFHDGGLTLQSGLAPTYNSRWGDFEATSYDGVGPDDVWFAAQYSGSNGDWATVIGKDKYTLTSN
jgi:hypothetical protein